MATTPTIPTTLKALGIAAASMAAVLPAPATADPGLPYGPDTCIQGLVWREARSGDTVCVTPAFRARTAQENADPGANKDPNGAYGPQSCAQGFVWREAFDGDTVCVTPAIRQENWTANAAAQGNYQRNQPGQGSGARGVTFEVTGSGEVFNIVTDPPTAAVADHTRLPWVRTLTQVPADIQMLQVVATGRDAPGPGCRIILDGKVVAEQPVGGSAHCIWTP